MEGCVECGMPESCDNRDRLHRMRSGALDAGLIVKCEDADQGELVEEWTTDLKSKWPTNILFERDQ